MTYLLESIDGEYSHLLVILGVVHDVQVHQLFQFEVGGCDALQNVCEQARNIFPDGHQSNDLLYGFLLGFFFQAI